MPESHRLFKKHEDRGVQRLTNREKISNRLAATTAKIANGLLPRTTTELLSFAARLLPKSNMNDGDRHAGAASHSGWTDNPLTMLNTAAMREMNQVPFVQSKPADAE